MKQFDPNKPYCRRDGKPARIVHTFHNGNHFVVLDDTDGWVIVNAKGEYHDVTYNNYDLINIPEKFERWINVYSNGDLSLCLHNSMEIATKMASTTKVRIACIKVSFTEGEGLE